MLLFYFDNNINNIINIDNNKNINIIYWTYLFIINYTFLRYFFKKIDYVDKGQSPIEVLAYLCSLKILYPDRIFMLCGNHDYVNIEKSRTSFYHLCKDVYSIYDRGEADKIYPYISVMLSNLPCAASVDHEIFCSHGGIPRIVSKDPGYDIMAKVREITRPFSKNDQLHTLIFYDLIWSDPIYTKSDDGSIPEEVENDEQNPFPKYFYPSPRTNYSKDPNDICSFSKMALVNFLRKIGHKYMIRSHQHYEVNKILFIIYLLF